MRVVITGGAKGLGRAFTEAMVADGADVMVTGRDKVALDEVRAELGVEVMEADLAEDSMPHVPDRFDVRRDTRGHLGFGHGPHRCIGAELGRLETEIGLRMFFERFPHTTLVDEPVRWRSGAFMRRLDRLPVILG
ncbi:SDR family NAD(P)-dependent oxidoreductase [Lentzea tibetensis]|uniref:SDR family NAD(P)-dependent oxidoreductase n=1 Tax=Lentzea tibetensis TaxID=2591470 RepID=A0A563F3I6_9PSEU|nr:SDR family NAD(P)-dependent oxidoreductase [Lentzea tibetensis]TWP53914.1 SDR family NAD(P)-dependent oxidoreductase [Lentzea tibetensis]